MNKYYKAFVESKEKPITRKIIFEKCKPFDFESNGLKYWYDKNGNVIRIDDDNESLDMKMYIGFKGTEFLQAGYVYAPYVPMIEAQIDIESSFFPSHNISSRYATKQVNSNYYSTICF